MNMVNIYELIQLLVTSFWAVFWVVRLMICLIFQNSPYPLVKLENQLTLSIRINTFQTLLLELLERVDNFTNYILTSGISIL